jgi:hypothetical protein
MQDYSPATIRAYDMVRRGTAFSGILPDAVEPTRLLVERVLQIAQAYRENDLSDLRARLAAAFSALHAHLGQQIAGIGTNLSLVQSATNDLVRLRKIPRDSEDNVINSCFGSLRYLAADLMAGVISGCFVVMNRLPNAAAMGAVLDSVREDFEYLESVSENPSAFAALLLTAAEGYAVVEDAGVALDIDETLDQLEDIIVQIDEMISKENRNISLLKDNLLASSNTQALISLQRSGFGKDILARILSDKLIKELDIITKVP